MHKLECQKNCKLRSPSWNESTRHCNTQPGDTPISKGLRETTLFSKPPHSWGIHSLLAIAVWHGPVRSDVIDVDVTLMIKV